jgi:hypothetical protein
MFAMFIIVPFCMCGTAYLIPKEGAPQQKGNGSVKAFDGNFGYRPAYTTGSRVVHHATKPAEMLYGEIPERFGFPMDS